MDKYIKKLQMGLRLHAVTNSMQVVDKVPKEMVQVFEEWVKEVVADGQDVDMLDRKERMELNEKLVDEKNRAILEERVAALKEGEPKNFGHLDVFLDYIDRLKKGFPLEMVLSMMERSGLISEEEMDFFKSWLMVVTKWDGEAPDIPIGKSRANLTQPESLQKLTNLLSGKDVDDGMVTVEEEKAVEVSPMELYEKASRYLPCLLPYDEVLGADNFQTLKHEELIDVAAHAFADMACETDIVAKKPDLKAIELNHAWPSGRELLESLFLDPFTESVKAQGDDVAFLVTMISSLEKLDPGQEMIDLLKFAACFANYVGEQHRVDGFRELCAGLEIGNAGLFLIKLHGDSHVALVVTREEREFYQVAVCTKYHYQYHPQYMEQGKMRICPILTYRTPRTKLLDPTFAVLLMHESVDVQTIYEVLLPYLANGEPIIRSFAEQEPGMIWTNPGRASSRLSPLLCAIRHFRFGKQDKAWHEFKFSYRQHVASHLSRDIKSSETRTLVAHQLAVGMRKNPEMDSCQDLIEEFSAPTKALPAQPSMRANDLDLSLVENTCSIFAGSDHVQRTINCLHNLNDDSGRAPTKAIDLDWTSDMTYDFFASLLSKCELIYLQEKEDEVVAASTVVGMVEHIMSDLRFNPLEWSTSLDWSDGAQQRNVIQAILELAKLYYNSHLVLSRSETILFMDGNHIVVLGVLYCFANATIFVKDGGSKLSQVMNDVVIRPCDKGFNGQSFQEVTGMLCTTPSLMNIRSEVVEYLESMETEEQMWDFEHLFGRSRLTGENNFTIEVLGKLLRIEGSWLHCCQSFCENEYSSEKELMDFFLLRDLACLFQYVLCPPLHDEDASSSTPKFHLDYGCLGGKVEVNVFVKVSGLETISHSDPISRRKYIGLSNPSRYLDQALGSQTEYAFLYVPQLPTFGNYMSEEESERLLSFLTVPYIRIPCILAFFAQNRTSLLFQEELLTIFCSVLLEPGLLAVGTTEEPVLVPANKPLEVPKAKVSLFHVAIQDDHCQALFVEILGNVLGHCKSSVAPTKQMLTTLCKLLWIGAQMEVVHQSPALVALLRGDALAFFERNQLPELCILTFHNAPTQDIEKHQDQLLTWCAESLNYSKNSSSMHVVHQFLAKWYPVLRNVSFHGHLLDGSLALQQKHGTWELKGNLWVCGDLSFNGLTGKIKNGDYSPISGRRVRQLHPQTSTLIPDLAQQCFKHSLPGSFQLAVSFQSPAFDDHDSTVLVCISNDGEISAVKRDAKGQLLLWIPKIVLENLLPPAVLLRHDHFWFDEQGRKLIANDAFYIDFQHGTLDIVNESGLIFDRYGNHKSVYDRFLHLDNKEFVQFWLDPSKKRVEKVHFPRFDVTFLLDKVSNTYILEGNQNLFVLMNDENMESLAHLFRGIQRGIVLTNGENEEFGMFPISVNSDSNFQVGIVRIATTRTWFIFKNDRLAALHLFVEKLANQFYDDAFDMISACAAASDSTLSMEERFVMDQMDIHNYHPDACAVRLKFYETTIVRKKDEKPPLHANVLNDCARYALSVAHVSPRLVLDDISVNLVFKYALGLGKRKLKSNMMAVTENLDADFGVSSIVTIVSGFMEKKTGTCVPLHGGGGYHRLQAIASTELERIMEADEGLALVSLPDLRTFVFLSSLTTKGILEWCTEIFKIGSLNVAFRELYKLLCNREGEPSLFKLNMVELVTRKLYIMTQQFQNTPMWEMGAFLFLVASNCQIHVDHLPPMPFMGQPANFFSQLFWKLEDVLFLSNGYKLGFQNKKKFRLQCPTPRISSGPRFPVQVRFERSRVFDNADFPMRLHQHGCVLEDSTIYSFVKDLVSTEVVGAREAKHGGEEFFHKLQAHPMVKSCKPGRTFLERIQQDCDLFDLSPEEKIFFWDQIDEDLVMQMLKLVDEELVKEKQSILDNVGAIMRSLVAKFSHVDLVARCVPSLTFRDLTSLLLSKEGLQFGKEHDLPLSEVVAVLLQATRFQQLGKVRGSLVELRDTLAIQIEELFLESLFTKRGHCLDPRKLCFEFEAGYILRESQVSVVTDLLDKAANGENVCLQMKMGAGKSSTIFPLLTMFLTGGETLTVFAVPDALVAMCGEMLMNALGNLFGRQFMPFQFTRNSIPEDTEAAIIVVESMIEKLSVALNTCSVVLATPGSLKALVLKIVEELSRPTIDAKLASGFRCLATMFVDAKLLLDECDMSFHPLRSELNFPVGPKEDLAHRRLRVEIASCLVQSVFDQKNASVIRQGIDARDLQGTPHIMLTNESFYARHWLNTLVHDLVSFLVNEKFSDPETRLQKVPADGIKNVVVDSRLPESDEFALALNEKEKFWCSAEHPKCATLQFSFVKDRSRTIKACEIRFRPYSSFLFASGLSMLPSRISILVSYDNGQTFHEEGTSGEFLVRKFFFRGTKQGVTDVKLLFTGSARWFAVDYVHFFSERRMTESEETLPAPVDLVRYFVAKCGSSPLLSRKPIPVSKIQHAFGDNGEIQMKRRVDFFRSSLNPQRVMLTFAFRQPISISGCDIYFKDGCVPDFVTISTSSDNGKTYLTTCPQVHGMIYQNYEFARSAKRKVTHVQVVCEGPQANIHIDHMMFFREEELKANEQPGFVTTNRVAVTLALDYLGVFLPHCLGKLHTVGYGIVRDGESTEMNETRRFMAIPFLGKDTPSKASEFAHPDIMILLTFFAYLYGGLRVSDVHLLLTTLKEKLKLETGPLYKRPSFVRFEQLISVEWESGTAQPNEYEGEVLPLHLFQAGDAQALEVLWKRIRFSKKAINEFLETIAFPKCLKHRSFKYQGSGEELLLLTNQGCCIGMSGTPSAMMPRAMGKCEWEPLTEAKFLRTLTHPQFASISDPPLSENDMEPGQLVGKICRETNATALIDSGAFIVGISNREFAEKLLAGLPMDRFDGVVFLDENDRKMILNRHGIVQPLSSSAVPMEKRFVFFDQVHTTGMDIPQPSTAHALLTISKDMTFRDFAQAAWRMRRLGKGQKLTYIHGQSLEKLISLEDAFFVDFTPLEKIAAYLYLNSVKSMLAQMELLLRGHLATVWRRRIWTEVALHDRLSNSSLSVFKSEIRFDLDADNEDESLKALAKKHKKFIIGNDDAVLIKQIIAESKVESSQNNKIVGKLWREMKRIVGKVFLDSEAQQERSSSKISMSREQQQEREKEQHVQTMEMLHWEQNRSWVGQQHDVTPWRFQEDLFHESAFVPLSMISLEGEDDGKSQIRSRLGNHIFVSKNHTQAKPPKNSRLLNVEIVAVIGDSVGAVTLREAETIQWLQDNQKKKHGGIRLILPELHRATSDELLLLRFFNASSEFAESEVQRLDEILENRRSERLTIYTISKSMRRRAQAPGYETSDDCNLKRLFL